MPSPGDSQSWNRYSYTFNNPLACTDPSGNISIGEVIKLSVVAMFSYATGGWAAGAYGTSAGAALGISMAGGAVIGAMQTGTLRGSLTAAFGSAMFFGIGEGFTQANASWAYKANGTTMKFSGYAAKALSHGVAGGVMAELQGGRFGHGFLSAGFSQALSPATQGGNPAGRMLASVVIGGTASKLGGGKFANGAVTAAFGFAFNETVHKGYRGRGSYDEEGEEAISNLKLRAQEIAYRDAGQDGVVDISGAELGEVFKYEAARLELRSKVRGGYENLSDVEFVKEAYDYGDSLFFGNVKEGGNGGRLYRIDGRGPYFGGNINYINQGQIFAIGSRTLDQAVFAVKTWNSYGAGSPQYLDQRIDFTKQGYRMQGGGR